MMNYAYFTIHFLVHMITDRPSIKSQVGIVGGEKVENISGFAVTWITTYQVLSLSFTVKGS